MHIHDKYTGCVECYTGCKQKKNTPKKLYKVFALYVTYYHFKSTFNIILCMRDTVVLK